MDINNIFNLFNNSQDDEYDDTSLLIDFSDHPLFWIGGFNKLIGNHLFFKEHTIKIFKHISPELNIEEVEKAGEHLMFEKAWEYIKNINLENQFHIECIRDKSSEEFLKNIDFALRFFEELEEYERCALLKGIENKIKEFKFKLGD
jgi:hypothetical protein